MKNEKGKEITDVCQFKKGKKYISEPEVRLLTMEETAEKFGCDVNELKIKK